MNPTPDPNPLFLIASIMILNLTHIFQIIFKSTPLVCILVHILSYINNCADMSIGDTLTRVIIVIEHPQIQLAFIIPIYIKQVVNIILTVIMSILEFIVTGLYISYPCACTISYPICIHINIYYYAVPYNPLI